MDYSLVLGIDKKHVDKLRLVAPTWFRHKPDLFTKKWIVFLDHGVDVGDVIGAMPWKHGLEHPVAINPMQWPRYPAAIADYIAADRGDKWYAAQRHKMLAGFVHTAAAMVQTDYWLKIDLDAVAMRQPDWIEPAWFKDEPAIVAPAWGYTKPPDQMEILDAWVAEHDNTVDCMSRFWGTAPLDLHPKPGAGSVRHPRIASWCAFFNTEFTRLCAGMATQTCGPDLMPVPSQDGFMWYVATRLGLPIVTANMKRRGWAVRNSTKSIRDLVQKAMGEKDG